MIPEGHAWKLQAACQADPGLFFPDGREGARQRDARESAAKALCAICPVFGDCLDYGLGGAGEAVVVQAILAGMNEEERRNEKRRRLRKRVALVGCGVNRFTGPHQRERVKRPGDAARSGGGLVLLLLARGANGLGCPAADGARVKRAVEQPVDHADPVLPRVRGAQLRQQFAEFFQVTVNGGPVPLQRSAEHLNPIFHVAHHPSLRHLCPSAQGHDPAHALPHSNIMARPTDSPTA